MDQDFDKNSAVRVSRGYRGSYHDLWRDGNGRTMLGCTSSRGPGVAVNFAALERFRQENGNFIGLKNPDFSVVVSVSMLDGFEPLTGNDYIIVRGSDVGVHVADNVPFPF
jgi:hypothetical protein